MLRWLGAISLVCATSAVASAQVMPTAPVVQTSPGATGTVVVNPTVLPGIPTGVPVSGVLPGPIVESLPPGAINTPVSAPTVLPPGVTGQPGPTIYLGIPGPPAQPSIVNGSVIDNPMGTALTPVPFDGGAFPSSDPFALGPTALTPAPVVIQSPTIPNAAPLPVYGISMPPSSPPTVVVVESPASAPAGTSAPVTSNERVDAPTLRPGAAPFVIPIANSGGESLAGE